VGGFCGGAVRTVKVHRQVEIFFVQHCRVALGHGHPIAIGLAVALCGRTLAEIEQQVEVDADRVGFAIGAVRADALDFAGIAHAADGGAAIVIQFDIAGRVIENLHIGTRTGIGAALQRRKAHWALFGGIRLLSLALSLLGNGSSGHHRRRNSGSSKGGQDATHLDLSGNRKGWWRQDTTIGDSPILANHAVR